jgi:hypothetical protein
MVFTATTMAATASMVIHLPEISTNPVMLSKIVTMVFCVNVQLLVIWIPPSTARRSLASMVIVVMASVNSYAKTD